MIDSHAHLWFDRFDEDRDAVIERARAAGVEHLIVVGIDLASSRAAAALASRTAGLSATAGVHPCDVGGLGDEDWTAMETLLASGDFVAVGETGLDFYWKKVGPDEQYDAFARHLEWGRRFELPVIIHCRDAFAELLDYLEARRSSVRGVMHCYSGDADQARRCLDLGLDLSFAGPISYPKSAPLREAAQVAPLDRLHVETDCPFLPPQAHRGHRNEPAWVPEIVAALAAARGEDARAVAAATTANSRRLFRI